jgi:6,7-dimethyl-8-ribityllumazine synthase
MMRKFEQIGMQGNLDARGHRFAIIVSRLNVGISEALLASALDGFTECGAEIKEISIYWVPGPFEIGLLAKKLALSGKFNAILTLGCLIKGETQKFNLLSHTVVESIQKISIESGVPILCALLATENLAQAEERVDAGRNGALSAIEMASLMKLLD